jgi:hypothetical protein
MNENDFVKELNELLVKYKTSMIEARRIYSKHKSRLVQYHEYNDIVWSYYHYPLGKNNICGCGSNCCHYEYDKLENKIYGVCDGCGAEIYEIKKEYIDKELKVGRWLSKNE